MRAYLIKARGDTMPHQQAGYKAAILSLSPNEKSLQTGTGPYKGRKKLKLTLPAIDHQFGSQHESRRVGRQEQRGSGEFISGARAANQYALRYLSELGLRLGFTQATAGENRCVCRTWCKAQNAHTGREQIGGQILRQRRAHRF